MRNKTFSELEAENAQMRDILTEVSAWRDEIEKAGMREAKLRTALKDIQSRARRIREDKAIVGTEAFYIEQIAKDALQSAPENETKGVDREA